jgi:hypothetical protein
MKQAKMTTAQAIGKLMKAYDHFRAKWFKKFGNYEGFDTWFTGRLMKGNS